MGADNSAIASVTAIDTQYKDQRTASLKKLPQRIYVLAQGATASTFATTKFEAPSASFVGDTVGYGSPAHLIAEQLLPVNGDGVSPIPVTIAPIDDDGSGVAAAGDITPSGTAAKQHSLRVRIGGILSNAFLVPAGAVAGNLAAILNNIEAACAAVLRMPAAVVNNADTDATVTVKWKGASGNATKVEIIGDTDVTWAITQPTGGLVNPDVTPALAQIGNKWETIIINAMNVSDTTTLDAIQTWGDGRWGSTVRKPAVAFVGDTTAAVAGATTVSDARPTDKVNAQISFPGSPMLPFIAVARAVARIAKVANNVPAKGYVGQKLTGLVPGLDSEQWDDDLQNTAQKAGTGTTLVEDNVIELGDILTMYKPTGEDPPAFRYVVNIMKLMNLIYNVNLEFTGDDWNAAPLVPDDEVVEEPSARKPRHAKAAVTGILQSAGKNAIISNSKTAIKNTKVKISASNADRLDITMPVQLSGNTRVKSVDLFFSFFFGGSEA
jgi:phage tail sheath gpL-like